MLPQAFAGKINFGGRSGSVDWGPCNRGWVGEASRGLWRVHLDVRSYDNNDNTALHYHMHGWEDVNTLGM